MYMDVVRRQELESPFLGAPNGGQAQDCVPASSDREDVEGRVYGTTAQEAEIVLEPSKNQWLDALGKT
jgi:hypothetical protein